MEPITVLSPHRDDASFSLGLTLSIWSAASIRLRVLNFFTQSAYAPHCSARTVAEISAIRAEEDKCALTFIHPDLEIHSLDLLDAPLRLHLPFGEITRLQSSERISPEELQQLSQGIQQHCAGALVVAPLGLGNHVDHMAVQRAAIDASPPEQLAFYEDLPYVTWTSPDDVQARVESLQGKTGIILEPFIVRTPDAVTRKRRIVSFYESQITTEEADTIAQFAGSYGNGERLWLPAKGEGWNAIQRLATKPPQTATPDLSRQPPV